MRPVSGKAQNAAYLVKTKMQFFLGTVVQSLPIKWLDWLLHRIERLGSPENLDLNVSSWRTEAVITQTIRIAEGEILELTPTSGDQQEPSTEKIRLPPLKSWKLHGVSLDVDSGLVFVGDRVIQQSGGATRSAKDAAFISGGYLRYQKQDSIESVETIAPLGDTWHHYHFLIETLPRTLHALAIEPETVFVTSQEPSSAAREILDALEIPIKLTQPSTVFSCSDLILVDNPIKFSPRSADLQVVRSAFQTVFNLSEKNTHQSIYISRSKSQRALQREAILEKALEENGVKIVHMQSLSVFEQLQIVSQSDTIIGPHGAGLGNLIMLPTGGKVIELTSGDRYESCYRHMCAALEIDYALVEIPGSEQSPDGKVNDESITQILALLA